MSGGGLTRLPAAPAQDALRRFARRHGLRTADLAEVLPVDARLLDSVMQRRWLPWPLADSVAVALRCHPSALWPDWFRLSFPQRDDAPHIANATTSAERT